MTYSPLDDHWVILTTSKAFYYYRARQDVIRFAFDPKILNKFLNFFKKLVISVTLWQQFWIDERKSKTLAKQIIRKCRYNTIGRTSLLKIQTLREITYEIRVKQLNSNVISL